MIDFPASPTVGQQFTAAGVTWVWDGTKWTASGLGVAYVPLAGGTMTGQLILNADPGSNLAAATKQYVDTGDATLNTNKVAKAGDTMTGTLTIGNGQSLILDAPSGTARNFDGTTGGSFRWNMQFGNATAESGVSGGSDFALSRFNNSGSYIDSPLIILRGNGVLQAADGISAPNVLGDNRVINGDMRIDQRNNGAQGTAIAYTVDRWMYSGNQANKITWGRQAGGAGLIALGANYYLGLSTTTAVALAASDTFQLYQPIEADMVGDLAWGTSSAKPVTLSFIASAAGGISPGTFSGSIRNYTGTRSYPFTFSIPGSAWYQFSITIPGDTAGTWVTAGNAGAMLLTFDLGCGATSRAPAGAWVSGNYIGANGAASLVATQGASFQLTQVKLEAGNVATPFNHPPLAQALAACQRYYYQRNYVDGAFLCSAQAFGTAQAGGWMQWPVPMRASATVTASPISCYNSAGGTVGPNAGGTISSNLAGTFMNLSGFTGLTAGYATTFFLTTGGYLTASAEL